MASEETSERFRFRHLPSLIKDTVKSWNDDDPWRLSAIVAYYAILSLPGLLVIVFNVLSYFWGAEIVEGFIYEEIEEAMGAQAAETMRATFERALDAEDTLIATLIGVGALIFGATGVFYHLQISLNNIWEVKSSPKSALWRYVIDRARSFGFVLVIAFLLLLTFIVSALLSALADFIPEVLPGLNVFLIQVVNIALSLAVVTLLFALIFKYLPDIDISWKSVWGGAIIASLLFAIGKEVLTIYFSETSPGSVYGAAGSIIIILLWVTYSCLILLFGAEFTWVVTKRYGYRMEPKKHARLVNKKHILT